MQPQVRSGCHGAWMPLSKASVFVEYEVIDSDAQVLAVLINGMWIDPQDVLADHVFDGWQEELTRQVRADKDDHKRPRERDSFRPEHVALFDALMQREAA